MKAHVLLLVSSYVTPQDPRRGAFFAQHVEYYRAAGWNVGLVALNQQDISLAHYLKGARLFPESRTAGAPVILNPVYHTVLRRVGLMSKSRALALTGERAVRAYIARHGRPDIIHAHGIDDVAVHAAAMPSLDGIPIVVTEHNSKFLGGASSLATARRRQAVNRAALIIGVSTALETALQQAFSLPKDRTRTIPNIVHPTFFDVSRPARRGQFTLFTVSYLTEKKRIDLALDAFAATLKGTGVQFRIAGFGPAVPALEAQSERLGLTRQITFTGPLSKEQVAAEMAAADCYLCTSDVETFGIPLAEAIATGTPAISTRCGGPEDIVNGSNGILVDVGDRSGLSQALAKMADTHAAFDAAAIRDDARRFSPDLVLPAIAAAYADALGASR